MTTTFSFREGKIVLFEGYGEALVWRDLGLGQVIGSGSDF